MEKMQTKAILRSLRISPRKARLLVDLVRGMKVEDAIKQLQFSKKDAAKPLLKLLNSAIANASHNHEMKRETLVIRTVYVDGGPVLHRWTPRAMGRATPIKKRTSHITVILEGEGEAKKQKKIKEEKIADDTLSEKSSEQKEINKLKVQEKKNVKDKKDVKNS